MQKFQTNTTALVFVASLITLCIFIADILTPLGIAWGFLYLIVVLLTLWIPGKTSTLFAGIIGIILTVLKLYISTADIVALYIVYTNRSLSVAGILITMFGILKYKEKEKIVCQQKEELEKLTEELKISNSDLEQFAYVASHDLQEPLRKIQSFGERIILTEKERLSETGRDYFSRMMNASSRMQILINDLLSYSRLSTRREAFLKIDLNEVVKEVLVDMEVAIEKNNVKVDLKYLPFIDADKTQMRQLFQNLISNAIKFKKEDENSVIKIYGKKLNPVPALKKEFAEITVEDNGIGFEEKYSDKIFQFFQRLEGKKYEGSGIGLAVCRKIVLRHGGTITVTSNPGIGSKFIIMLPTSKNGSGV